MGHQGVRAQRKVARCGQVLVQVCHPQATKIRSPNSRTPGAVSSRPAHAFVCPLSVVKSWFKFVARSSCSSSLWKGLTRRRSDARGQSGRGLPHSMTLRDPAARSNFRQVLECASPLALCPRALERRRLRPTTDHRRLTTDGSSVIRHSSFVIRPPRPGQIELPKVQLRASAVWFNAQQRLPQTLIELFRRETSRVSRAQCFEVAPLHELPHYLGRRRRCVRFH